MILLRAMLKEEWRVHSSLFGSVLFALFPVIIMFFGFAGAFVIENSAEVNHIEMLVLIIHYGFFLIGAGAGSFALSGREVMNRRFGQASLIAYSSRTLPVSLRIILFNYLIKEIIYYIFLWILPFCMGFAFMVAFGIPLFYVPLLFLTVLLSFLLGLSLIFFLSTIYVYSKKLLFTLLVALFVVWQVISFKAHVDLLKLLPTYDLFMTGSLQSLAVTLGFVFVFILLSVLFARIDFPSGIVRYKNSFVALCKRISFSKYASFISKDVLDLERSAGGFGKYVFSFIVPLVVIGLIISLMSRYVYTGPYTLLFAMFTAMLSSSFYSWLTEYDLFSSYAFFPVKVSDVLNSKMLLFSVMNIASFIAIAFVAVWKGEIAFIGLAFLVFIPLSVFTLALTVYLGGLRPNVYLLNAKLFGVYILSLLVVMITFYFLSVKDSNLVIFSLVLIPVSGFIIQKSYRKWSSFDVQSF